MDVVGVFFVYLWFCACLVSRVLKTSEVIFGEDDH